MNAITICENDGLNHYHEVGKGGKWKGGFENGIVGRSCFQKLFVHPKGTSVGHNKAVMFDIWED